LFFFLFFAPPPPPVVFRIRLVFLLHTLQSTVYNLQCPVWEKVNRHRSRSPISPTSPGHISCGANVELRYGIHEAREIKRFGKPDPHTLMVTLITLVTLVIITIFRHCQFGHDVIRFIICFWALHTYPAAVLIPGQQTLACTTPS
jgi:hypothetical protein